MSDSRDAKNEFALEQSLRSIRSDPAWAHVTDPSILDYYATNSPAGFDRGFAPGDVLDPSYVARVIGALNMPGYYEGVDGMTLDKYLADPRSVIKVENGKFVYRPELAKGDFISADRESFMESLGAIPMLASFLAGPIMSVAGAGAAGAAAGGAGAAGTELAAGGAMDMGVGLGGSLGSWGGITPLAEGGLGSFLSEIPLGNFSNALEGGVNFADSFAANPWESVLNPSNINLSSGGFNSIDQIINSIASGGAQTFGSVGAGGALGSMLGTAPLAGIGGSSIWDTLSKVLNLGSNSSGSNPLTQIGQFGGSLLEYLQSKGVGKDLASALASATERGDPFGSQRPFYQNELKNSYSDPNYFNNSPVFKGMRDTIINDVGRTMSAQGYSGSPNTLYEIADRLQKTGMNYATQFQGQLAQNAGAGISPGTSAAIAAQGANTVAQSQKQANGALGATLGNLPNLINGIQGLI